VAGNVLALSRGLAPSRILTLTRQILLVLP